MILGKILNLETKKNICKLETRSYNKKKNNYFLPPKKNIFLKLYIMKIKFVLFERTLEMIKELHV